MIKSKFCTNFLIFWFLLNPISVSASFFDTYDPSLNSASMGGAYTAIADDFSATFCNPSGLAQFSRNQVYIEYVYADTSFKVKKREDNTDLIIIGGDGLVFNSPANLKPVNRTIIGVELNLNKLIKIKRNLQAGVIISPSESGQFVTNLVSYPPDQPNFFLYGENNMRGSPIILAAVGIETVKDTFFIGIGMASVVASGGTTFIGPNPPISSEEDKRTVVGYIESPIITEMTFYGGGIISLMDNKLKIGFHYRPAVEHDLVLDQNLDINLSGLAVALPIGNTLILGYDPEEFRLGAAISLESFLVSVEAHKKLWSDFQFGPNSKVLFEGSPDFKDTMDFKLGCKYRFKNPLEVMVGYRKVESPVPDQSNRITNYLDMDMDIYTAGFNFEINRHWRISSAVTYRTYDEMTITKDNIKGVTWGHGTDPQDSYYLSSGNALTFGAGVRYTF